MKKSLILFSALFLFALYSSISLIAQSLAPLPPEGIVYQAEARDLSGKLLSNKTLEVKLIITQNSTTGTTVWEGINTVNTDKYGLFTLIIGKGGNSGYVFSDIRWDLNEHYLSVQLKLDGIWKTTGSMQFLSVPYAMHAKTAENVFSGDYFDLINTPYLSDILNESETAGWDKNEADDFNADFNSLLNVPYGLADGDDDTQLSEVEVDGFVANNEYITEEMDPVFTSWDKRSDITITESQITDLVHFTNADELDGDPANELQTLSIDGNTLSLSNGGSVILPNNTSTGGQYFFADKDGDGYGYKFTPVYVPDGVSEPAHFVNDFSDCNDEDESINPGAVDLPDGIDNNCDGIDGPETSAVFVAATGDDSNLGTEENPKRTINAAIAYAQSVGKTQVLISEGTYPERVIMANGISLYGGYSANWSQTELSNIVEVVGIDQNNRVSALEATGITTMTYISKISFSTPDASGLDQDRGKSNYGIICNNSMGLIITDCQIHSGLGANGMDGSSGSQGDDGTNGDDGKPGACDDDVSGIIGNGGTSFCDRYGGIGGRGGYDSDGESGAPGAGTNTVGGGGEVSRTLGVAGGSGYDGVNGYHGTNGSNGTGGNGGTVTTLWLGANGNDGTNGYYGNGGSGGGGGGGQGGLFAIDGTGNGGGGGGAGGCGGAGGEGGGAGGGSFGFLVANSPGIQVSNCIITCSIGGNGGAGGNKGLGGDGGSGGFGGTVCTNEVGAGGNGGNGGNGGDGGYGGGGAGGPSIGILKINSNVSTSGNSITFSSGGFGGTSLGNDGYYGRGTTIYNVLD